MKEFTLPEDFLMGTSVASVFVEGGNTHSNWYAWCEEGHIKDGSHVKKGTDHWNRYKEDIQLMKTLHHDTYSMSIDWSRVEPVQGKYDKKAIKHYRDEIKLMQKEGIRPVITLHHFANPLWIEEKGGWENPEIVERFIQFTRFVLLHIGDIVTDWITINDSNTNAIAGYLLGWFPPGKKDPKAMTSVLKHMSLAHIRCYQEIHKIRKEEQYPGKTIVGMALHLRVYQAKKGNILNRISAKVMRYFFFELLFTSMMTGKFRYPLGRGGYPLGKGKYYDFIGINYWTREMVSFTLNPRMFFSKLSNKKGAKINDGGWEIYPQGIYQICKKYYKKYKAPVFIMQTGLRDDKDLHRSHYIYESLRHVAQLISEGIPVERYYIWSLVDIFEGHQGESAKLGLVRNNFKTQQRTIRKSGKLYGEICKDKAVTGKTIKKYLEK